MSAGPLPTVDGGFGTILCDPPWAFRTYQRDLALVQRGPDQYYPVMSLADIKAMPIGDLAARDCALFMWIIDPLPDAAMEVAAAWGFTFKTISFVWVKAREHYNPVPGMGYWTRKQTEQCWLFTRGSPPRLGKGVEQIIYCPRGEHSAKPDVQYERIEALVGGPYLELFARSQRPGWTAWGNEVGVRDGGLFG